MAANTQPNQPATQKADDQQISLSILKKRWLKFKTLKRGYYSLIILTFAYALSFFFPLLINNRALVVEYEGDYFFPAVPLIGGYYPGKDFGQDVPGEADYRALKEKWESQNSDNKVIMPPYPYGPLEDITAGNKMFEPPYRTSYELRQNSLNRLEKSLVNRTNVEFDVTKLESLLGTEYRDKDTFTTALREADVPPTVLGLVLDAANTEMHWLEDHWFGTDNTGRDVFARMMYGFQISLSFALVLAIFEYLIGVSIGAAMGYFGGRFDLFFQRFIEIWITPPFLFVVIIVSSIIKPNFWLLVVIIGMFRWVGMTYFMRAEFYREKTRDYVAAALSMGQRNRIIIFKHILPNSLVPIITYFPFSMVAGIGFLVSLDFLGFGLPPPTPSWGQMVSVGLQNITKWWMVLVPLSALFVTLMMIVFIGEAIREAFDPKVFSRLR